MLRESLGMVSSSMSRDGTEVKLPLSSSIVNKYLYKLYSVLEGAKTPVCTLSP